MENYYTFDPRETGCFSIIHTLNLMGDNLTGVEVGVGFGQNLCSLLQNCPRIKTLWGIDNFKPYTDYKTIEDGKVIPWVIDNKLADNHKMLCYHNLKYSGFEEKAYIIEKDKNAALNDFSDNSLDFVFLDAYSNEQDIYNDISQWYNKIKNGGLISGHDYDSILVQKVVNEFREKNSINSFLSCNDRVWCWIKKE